MGSIANCEWVRNFRLKILETGEVLADMNAVTRPHLFAFCFVLFFCFCLCFCFVFSLIDSVEFDLNTNEADQIVKGINVCIYT